MIIQNSEYTVDTIMFHTSATPTGWSKNKTAQDAVNIFRKWHVLKNGWSDVAYHYVIMPDGEYATGRDIERIGAGAKGHNKGVIHVCLVPAKTVTKLGYFAEFYTLKQRKIAKQLIMDLELQAGSELTIKGHNDVTDNKLCPGFKARRFIFSEVDMVTTASESQSKVTLGERLMSDVSEELLGTVLEPAEKQAIQKAREKVDDALDILEDAIQELPRVVRFAANAAVRIIRGIFDVPDDIGGDED